GSSGDLRVVRQYADVVEQLLPIDGGLGDVLQSEDKELQRPPIVGRKEFAQWPHYSPTIALPHAVWNFGIPAVPPTRSTSMFSTQLRDADIIALRSRVPGHPDHG